MKDGSAQPSERAAETAKRFFAANLRRLMDGRGWTQSELARQAKLGRDVISTYMTERSLPTRATLERLAEALGVPALELLPPSNVEGDPSLPLNIISLASGGARVRMDMVMTLEQASEIMKIVAGSEQ